MSGTHSIEYVTRAVLAGSVWAGRNEDEVWSLATEHCSSLLGWKLLGHPPEVAGAALVLMGAGAGTWAALVEARRALGLNESLD